jgi:arginyl-tRNA--protein-N-Asp/Glu arginylyltransferase
MEKLAVPQMCISLHFVFCKIQLAQLIRTKNMTTTAPSSISAIYSFLEQANKKYSLGKTVTM